MKRSAWATWVGLGLAAVVDASAGELRGGVVAGANLATVQIERAPPDLQLEDRTSFSVGAVLAWRPREAWSVELRPSYVGRGARFLVAGQSIEIQSLNVELPLLVTREVGHGRARPYALLGGAIGYRTKATAISSSGEQDVGEDFGSTDASLRLGAGVRLMTTSSQPFIEVEYAWGFSDLNARGAGLGAGLGTIRNRGLQIRAGLSLRLGKT